MMCRDSHGGEAPPGSLESAVEEGKSKLTHITVNTDHTAAGWITYEHFKPVTFYIVLWSGLKISTFI